MKLYPIPGGVWVGTEVDFKRECKARGVDPKTLRGAREVPTAKPELMEFLNFHAVDVYRTGDTGPLFTATLVDVDALREQHNPIPGAGPRPSDLTPTMEGAIASTIPGNPVYEAANANFEDPCVGDDLATLFAAAPIKLQAELVVGFIDRLTG